MSTTDSKPYDVVLFGATGFTGALTAEYLAANAPPGTRWALAGRNQGKLGALRDRLATIDPSCSELPVLEADVSAPQSLADVAGSARVVITTVGPYLNFGEPLVAACASVGTDYVDLTGEPEFVDQMWLRYHERAKESGARIVHCCGFDSIPHDLGAYFTVRQLPEGEPLKVQGFVQAGGTFSGGTYHSAVTAFSRIRQMASAARERREREPRPEGRTVKGMRGRIRRESQFGAWAVPMPTIDPLVILRSARALDRYGPEFTYGHYLLLKRLPMVAGLAAGAGGMMAMAQLPPTRKLLLSMRKPGDGPTPEQRAKGWFRVRFRGEGGGRTVLTEVTGGDPGYGETAKMLAESALCLANDELPDVVGQLTPAEAMGDRLTERLQAAGIGFRVLES